MIEKKRMILLLYENIFIFICELNIKIAMEIADKIPFLFFFFLKKRCKNETMLPVRCNIPDTKYYIKYF